MYFYCPTCHSSVLRICPEPCSEDGQHWQMYCENDHLVPPLNDMVIDIDFINGGSPARPSPRRNKPNNVWVPPPPREVEAPTRQIRPRKQLALPSGKTTIGGFPLGRKK